MTEKVTKSGLSGLTTSATDRSMNEVTIGVYGPSWIQNFTANLPTIKADKKTLVSFSLNNERIHRAVVVGKGPSIFSKDHLKQLNEWREKESFLIIASDSTLEMCIEHGIIPSAVVSIDGTPLVPKFYAGIEHNLPDTFVFLAATVHPRVSVLVEALKLQRYWFLPNIDSSGKLMSVNACLQMQTVGDGLPNGISLIDTTGNVGGTCIKVVTFFPTITEICCLGLDIGYPEGYPIEQTEYYPRLINKHGAKEKVEGEMKHYASPDGMIKGYTDPAFEVYRESIIALAKVTRPRIFNCTEQGTLFSEHIVPMKFEDWLKRKTF